MKKIIKTALFLLCSLVICALSACAFNGESGQTSATETHIHTVLHWETVAGAGCENQGRRFGTCIECDNEVREEIPALGHNYVVGSCARCGAEAPSQELLFELNESGTGYILVNADGLKGTELIIPETYMGLPVVAVGENIFLYDTYVQSIVIPNTVTKIYENAFFGCEMLENLIIPESVTEIGYSAFHSCRSLKSVVLPKNLQSLGASAFERCESLESVVLPENLEIINSYTFAECSVLEDISLPETCWYIGAYAFYGCEHLTKIELPKNLKTINQYAFAYTGIDSIEFPQNGLNIYLGTSAFKGTWIKTLCLRGSISLENEVFAECEALESVTIEIYYGTAIGIAIFSNCPNLKSVVIEYGLRSITTRMFKGCESLEYIKIASSVMEICGEAFFDCDALKTIEYDDTEEMWENINKIGSWNTGAGEYTVKFAETEKK